MKNILLAAMLSLIALSSQAQKNEKLPRYFGETIVTDSSAAILIPTRYNAELLSTNKLALWHDYYANVIFYDMAADTYKKLFETDTYIQPFPDIQQMPANYIRSERGNKKLGNVSKNWIFYFVKPGDYNKNGKVDTEDPSLLYVSDKAGNKLKALTTNTENAVSIEIFDKQGFALVKMQR
ncbi:hypothetical protein OB13_16745, partial [Pontibacter sp. HJ8]